MSRRTIAMLTLLILVATVLFPVVRATIQQNARISALEKDVAAREQRIGDLQVQSARWQDPAYVRAQARERFNYVMPGEVGYVVLDTSQTEAGEKDPAGAAAREAGGVTGTWFGTLWQSTQEAGHAPADPLGTGSGG